MQQYNHVLKCARMQCNETGKFWKITGISKMIGKKLHRISKTQHDQMERMLNQDLECSHFYFLSFWRRFLKSSSKSHLP